MQYLVIILTIMLLTLGASSKWYYEDTQARIATLRENSAKLEVAAESNQNTITRLKDDAIELVKSNIELQVGLKAASTQVDALRDKFIDHDLIKLSLKKPGLIEKRINDATSKVFDDIANITSK